MLLPEDYSKYYTLITSIKIYSLMVWRKAAQPPLGLRGKIEMSDTIALSR